MQNVLSNSHWIKYIDLLFSQFYYFSFCVFDFLLENHIFFISVIKTVNQLVLSSEVTFFVAVIYWAKKYQQIARFCKVRLPDFLLKFTFLEKNWLNCMFDLFENIFKPDKYLICVKRSSVTSATFLPKVFTKGEWKLDIKVTFIISLRTLHTDFSNKDD